MSAHPSATATQVHGKRRSKTWATWLALVGGSLGLHRFYLHGLGDVRGWLHLPVTLIGLYGAMRMNLLGQEDKLAWLLVPLLGLMLAGTMLAAIVYGLTPDEKWNARFNAGEARRQTHWLTIFGVIVALMIGASVLMATIAFAGQRFFEYQAEEAEGVR